MTTIKLPLVAALLVCSAVASAEPNAKPRKPSVFAVDACEQVKTKAGSAMLCQASEKSRPRILTAFARVTMPDGSSWIVGR